MKHLLSCLFLLLTLAVSGQDTLTYQRKDNVPYRSGKTDAYMRERCVLDVYYPVRPAKLPVIVWFHGEGLQAAISSFRKN